MNINQIMKQAQQMQKKLEQMQEEMGQKEFEGAAGGGTVKIVINGKGEMLKTSLSKEIVDPEDIEVLEDLIVAAFNDAKKKLENETSDMMGGFQLPGGMKMPF